MFSYFPYGNLAETQGESIANNNCAGQPCAHLLCHSAESSKEVSKLVKSQFLEDSKLYNA